MGFGRGLLFTFCASILVAFCVGDEELSGSGVRCKILGQSGKIRIEYVGNNTDGNSSQSDSDSLTFQVDSITERDSQENAVGTTGQTKHSVNNLASQTFTFSAVNNVSDYQGIKVINVNLSATLNGLSSKLDVMVYLFLENGNVSFVNDTFKVFKGSLKFNLKLSDWEFCDAAKQNCKKGQTIQEGEFIDITLEVKSKGTPSKKSNDKICSKDSEGCPDVYDLGGGSLVVLNKGILLNGEENEMPDGFPSFEVKGSKKLFMFRIPKFNNTAEIDPTANIGGSEGGGEVSGGGETGGDTTTASPGGPTGSAAPALLFNLSALAFCLYVAATFKM